MRLPAKAYEQLTNEAAIVLAAVKDNIKDDSDMTWVYYDTVDDMRNEIDKYIAAFKNGSTEFLDEVNTHFAPTSAYQEHSMSNNWSEEYLRLSSRFDNIYAALNNYR